jgi:hypothetical protein
MLSQDLFLQKFNVKPNIVRHFSPFLYYQEVRTFHFLILLHLIIYFPSFLLFTVLFILFLYFLYCNVVALFYPFIIIIF